MTPQFEKEIDNVIKTKRFLLLLLALVVLLVAYPYFKDTRQGAFLGGLASLALIIFGIFAVRPNRHIFIIASLLGGVTAASSVTAKLAGIRGHPFVEGAFTVFYAFTTIAVFVEVIRSKEIGREAVYGIVCVYLLIGVTFGTLYDFLETVRPGSFEMTVPLAAGGGIGFRNMLFFSFMTLTTIGYGDIIPVTFQAQSLATIEGVVGVLYVAVLIARIVGIYSYHQKAAGK